MFRLNFGALGIRFGASYVAGPGGALASVNAGLEWSLCGAGGACR